MPKRYKENLKSVCEKTFIIRKVLRLAIIKVENFYSNFNSAEKNRHD